jgi:uncharacterized protein (DUF2062 family)
MAPIVGMRRAVSHFSPERRRTMHKRFKDVISKVLSQGISPHQLALTIALGVIIGVIPVVWGSTLLCALIAFFLRLNQAVIQAANYLTYPIQIVLYVPFYRMGAKIFPWGSSFSNKALFAGIRNEWSNKILIFIVANLKAVSAWLIIAPSAAILLYLILWVIFSRIPRFCPERQSP